MISNLRVLSQGLMDQILRYSTRKLFRHWTESSRIPASRKRSVWRTGKLKKKTISFEEDISLTWCTSTSVSLGPTILSRTITTYLQLFFRKDDIQEFDSKWDEISLSMTQIPSDDILQGLYKLRIRESEKLKTVLELYNMETQQKKVGTWSSQI